MLIEVLEARNEKLAVQVAQQKISGGLRSEAATCNRYAIRGYASTAVKHGADALAAIRDALAGNPWMPPAEIA